MTNLKGKRILYLGPPFFGYEYDIQKSIVAKGAKVDFFNERVFVSSLGKILVRLGIRFVVNHTIETHYEHILECAKEQPYDYLFVVSPETMTSDFVRSIKQLNPHIKTVLYMWDSIKNKNNSDQLLPVFDRTLTFDPNDRLLFPDVEFLPLFFVPEFSGAVKSSSIPTYSVSFIGTVHSDRYKLVRSIVNQFSGVKGEPYTFFYCPSKFLYILKKMFTKEFNGVSISDVSFEPLTKSNIFNILSLSNIVIDIEHPAQKGLTMRTLEVLASGCKLVTTNTEVSKYDFYHKFNICIVDRKNPKVPKEFIESTYKPVDSDLVNQYSLSSWLDNIFNF
jgi:hypothetical protein